MFHIQVAVQYSQWQAAPDLSPETVQFQMETYQNGVEWEYRRKMLMKLMKQERVGRGMWTIDILATLLALGG